MQFRFIILMKPLKAFTASRLTVLSHAANDTSMTSGVDMRAKLQCVTRNLLAEAATS